MQFSKSPKHLGQSISMAFLQVAMSIGIIGLMIMQTGVVE